METLIASAVSYFIPSAYMPVAVAALTLMLAIEQILPESTSIKANSTFQAVKNIFRAMLNKLAR